MQNVGSRYTVATLSHLATDTAAGVGTRRAAVVALGMIGDDRQSRYLGPALQDSDRSVRLLAERWIWELWLKILPVSARQRLQTLWRRQANDPSHVLRELAIWNAAATRHAVIWHLRGQALAEIGRADEGIESFQLAIQINPFFFPAWSAEGDLHSLAGRVHTARQCYQTALVIFPDLPRLRTMVAGLQGPHR